MTIHSGLKNFSFLTRITQVSGDCIRAEARFERMPGFAGLECMAQLAALHVRHSLDFDRHAFLLKVGRTIWPPEERVTGFFHLKAERGSRSSDTYAYMVEMLNHDGTMLGADLLIGSKPYDNDFKAQHLKARYRVIFENLQASKNTHPSPRPDIPTDNG